MSNNNEENKVTKTQEAELWLADQYEDLTGKRPSNTRALLCWSVGAVAVTATAITVLAVKGWLDDAAGIVVAAALGALVLSGVVDVLRTLWRWHRGAGVRAGFAALPGRLRAWSEGRAEAFRRYVQDWSRRHPPREEEDRR
ncbi:hypothetical protein [Gordonia sp. 852002-50395_SCH5434458]|uniref:hypothetical protein n=1 Tax=Gordonia sp. 852002-50395_SCH5434458 TaxID=1834090 RepID=UPI0007E98EA2|nr:hypothetical protein [Gordonia sp. 852002-50395_SCH5434458]OBC01734.1 hypothetical protein A5785_17195 [Gordonia sp. 852002-50395_SCH5434458]